MSIFINNATQVTNQQPLCDDWMTNPIWHEQVHTRFNQPDFKQFISPANARRMGKLLKCALSSAISCEKEAGSPTLDGILTGTGLGCIGSTEIFLNALLEDGEEGLSPTSFMLSTHNTISSQIAIALKCHNYNITYSHRGISFDSALFDAVLKFQLGQFSNAMVIGADEMTEAYFQMFEKTSKWKKKMINPQDLFNSGTKGTIAGENCVSIFLSDKKNEKTLCELVDTQIVYKPTEEKIKQIYLSLLEKGKLKGVDGIITGKNGDIENDNEYDRLIQQIAPNTPIFNFKHLFGESFTSSSVGLYIGAKCLAKQYIPAHLSAHNERLENPKSLLLINHFSQLDYSFTLLKSC